MLHRGKVINRIRADCFHKVGIYAEEDKSSLHVQRVTEALKATFALYACLKPWLGFGFYVTA